MHSDSDRCPAATGYCADEMHYHQCQYTARHTDDNRDAPVGLRAMHQCECGAGWTSLMGSIDDMIRMFTRSGKP
jgi:hypothetical protein